MGEQAFPPTGFAVAWLHVTFGGSGEIMTTARSELPYPCVSLAKSRGETSRRGKLCDGIASLDIIRWCNVHVLAPSRVLVICKIETRNFVKRVSHARIQKIFSGGGGGGGKFQHGKN